MKKLTKTLAGALCVLGLIAALAIAPAAKAADENIGTIVASIQVSPKLDKTDAASAIGDCLVARHWLVRDKTDGQIIAYYERGDNACTLTIRYDAARIDIFAVGKARGGGLPMRWIERLKADINQALSARLLTK